MKTLILLMLSVALLCGCATDHAYWQARADAIANLPAEQQPQARIDMLRDWKAGQDADRRAAALILSNGLQQAGAQMQQDAALRQAIMINSMNSTINRVPTSIPGY